MASGKSIELAAITGPVASVLHRGKTPRVNTTKDRTLAGKKRVQARRGR